MCVRVCVIVCVHACLCVCVWEVFYRWIVFVFLQLGHFYCNSESVSHNSDLVLCTSDFWFLPQNEKGNRGFISLNELFFLRFVSLCELMHRNSGKKVLIVR